MSKIIFITGIRAARARFSSGENSIFFAGLRYLSRNPFIVIGITCHSGFKMLFSEDRTLPENRKSARLRAADKITSQRHISLLAVPYA